MAAMLMERPMMAATRVFDSIQEQNCADAAQNLGVLLQHFSLHFSSMFETLGAAPLQQFSTNGLACTAWWFVTRRCVRCHLRSCTLARCFTSRTTTSICFS